MCYDTCSVDFIDMSVEATDGAPIRLWLRIVLMMVVVNLIGIYEARYILWGERAEATIEDLRQIAAGTQLNIGFRFQDDSGTLCRERETIFRDEDLKQGDQVQIEYVRGNPKSARVAGTGRPFAAFVFFATLIGLVVAVGCLWRHAHKALYAPRQPRFQYRRASS